MFRSKYNLQKLSLCVLLLLLQSRRVQDLHLRACLALCHLAECQRNCVALIDSGAVPLLVGLLAGTEAMDVDEFTQRQALRACALASCHDAKHTDSSDERAGGSNRESVWSCMTRIGEGSAVDTVKKLMSGGDEVERADASEVRGSF